MPGGSGRDGGGAAGGTVFDRHVHPRPARGEEFHPHLPVVAVGAAILEDLLHRHRPPGHDAGAHVEVERARVDATTISGYHAGGEDGLFQFGKSKDNPTLRQVKLMMATLDPLGLPAATEVVSGEQADDGLYIPIIDRVVTILVKAG